MKTKWRNRLNHLTQHLLFWVVSFFLLLRVMDQDGDITVIDVIYTLIFHIHLVIVVSLNTLFLIPRHLEKGQYVAYAFTTLANLGLGLSLYRLSFDPISDWLFPDFYFVAVYEWYETLGIIFVYLLFSTMLLLSKSWFQALALKKELAEVKQLSTDNELKMLRAQISPHFLFNSLNTIYGQSLKSDPQAPKSIMSLSEILRYNLQKSSEELALLEDEIKYLKDYIALQKARLEYPEQLRLNVLGEVDELRVPSLMIIEFLENALKYGNIQTEGAFIDLKITCASGYIEIQCVNSLDPKAKPKAESTGVGLENIRKRLELLYPGKYQLDLKPGELEYTLKLRLENG
jgi:hypothetical protein